VRISAVEPDPRHPGMVRVLVDGKLWGTVGAGELERSALASGEELADEQEERLNHLADAESAYRAVLRSLERRGHASPDLRRRLVRRGLPPPAVDSAIARAKAAGLLDDDSFARTFVETRSARGRGPARLRRDLLALGLDSGLIERALAAAWPAGGDPLELAAALARKRAAQLGDLPSAVKLRRVVAYLGRRGFSGPGVIEAVRRVIAGPGPRGPKRS
jgi:regulatory protein